MNLTNFNYPMFLTTDEEKKILRKCEFWYAEHPDNFIGLCGVLAHMNMVYGSAICTLRDKIPTTYLYIEDLCPKATAYVFSENNRIHTRRIRNLIRRIWITKLLNYKG